MKASEEIVTTVTTVCRTVAQVCEEILKGERDVSEDFASFIQSAAELINASRSFIN